MRTTLDIDDDLLEQAQFYTGIQEESALVREALKALIGRESAKRLAALGASEPQVSIIPRKLHKWDSAEHLQTEEDVVLYLEACVEAAGDDSAFIAKALGVVAKVRGMSKLSQDTGLDRDILYKALSGEINTSFDTILKVSHALGLRIQFLLLQQTT